MSGYALQYLNGAVVSLWASAWGYYDEVRRRAVLELSGMFSPGDGDVVIIGGGHGCGGESPVELIVPIVFFASVVAIVMGVVGVRHQTARRRLDLARVMVERGMEPPVDLLGQRVDRYVDLRRGVVLCFLGVGIVFAGAFSRAPEGMLGLIPGFIGLGYLVSYYLMTKGRGQ